MNNACNVIKVKTISKGLIPSLVCLDRDLLLFHVMSSCYIITY